MMFGLKESLFPFLRKDFLYSAGCGWWLVLVYCERELLLTGWRLVAGAGLV